MQQIERYGVIALVFLLVTIVAVSFWGDSKSPGFWARLTGRAKKAEVAQTDLATPLAPEGAAESVTDGALPLSPPSSSVLAADPAPMAPIVPASPFGSPNPAPVTETQLSAAPYVAETLTLAPSAPLSIGSAGSTRPAGPEYVVQKGDSLGSIARRTLGNASRWPEIQSLNDGVEPRSLKVGMKLVLPATASLSRAASVPKAVPSKKAAPKEAPKSSGATYVVQKGDSLRSIAARKLGDSDRWREIAALNPGLDPQKLAAGKSIRVPSSAGPVLVAAALPESSSASGKPRVR